MDKLKHLIIGCGTAAVSAAEQINNLRPEDEIKLITMEDCDPYSPMSLTYVMSGRITREDICMREAEFFRKINATVIRGWKVTLLDTTSREIVLDNDQRESFDRLLIATGADPYIPDLPGLNSVPYQGFHILEDMDRIMAQVADKKDILVYGGGLVAMSLALSLLEIGCEVKVVVRSRILRTYFDEVCGDMIKTIFQDHGCKIYDGGGTELIRNAETGVELQLEDGTVVSGAYPVICVGVSPRTGFINGSGVNVNNGVVVNRRMQTNVDGIFAAGDVAESPNFYSGEQGLSPILLSAVDQGKIAGSNMAGEAAEYEGWVPMNTFNFFGNRAVSIGIFDPKSQDKEVLTAHDPDKKIYKKLVLSNGSLVGASFLNVSLHAGLIQSLIRNRLEVEAFKEQLLETPRETSAWLMLTNETA